MNVFFDYRAHLEAECPNARFVSLPDNFRSHADILSFVDRIFSQPAVFGDRFLSLSPKGTVNHKPDPIFIDRPRIEAALFDTRVGGPGLGEARRRSAQRIAEHFASLREAGIAPGDMALLLGSMSSVGVYAEALRMTGFECLVSGGSTFSASPEVQLVGNILRLLSSRYDDAALYEVLSSPLFSVSDDAFVCLATRRDAQGRVHRRTLSQGLYAWERERDLCGLTEEKRDNLDFAHLCLDAARRSAARAGQTAGIRDLIRASGWFVRLERQGTDGQAIVGNVYKALRMVERLEAQGLGPARLADRFVADCESLKLTPGTLSTTSSDFVTIMTVHASKGLEFPHVAVAELRMNGSNAQLTAENVGGQTYLALRPRSIQPWRQTADGLRQFSAPFDGTAEEVVEARTPGERHWALKAYERTQETAEARRLLYVALTRASKSLFLGLVFRGNKDNRYIDVMSDLWSALEWDPNPEARVQLIEYGGSAPMRLEYIRLDTPGEESVSQLSDEQPFLIPAHPLPKPVYSQPLTGGRANVCSYTSLHDEEPLRRANNPDEEFFEALAVDPESDATALGLAFHRLAQYAICEGRLVRPCSEAVDAQVRLQGLTPTQATRLDAALSRWFDSGCASELLGSHGMAQAEVPFMVHLAGGIMGERFLEGEIDALAVDNEGTAWLVDYKTGGTPFEAPAEIEQKHLLQAQCYAYALLCEGYQEVRCAFVRVEQDDAAHPGWPQVQEYRFVSADRQALETMLLTRMAEVSVAGR